MRASNRKRRTGKYRIYRRKRTPTKRKKKNESEKISTKTAITKLNTILWSKSKKNIPRTCAERTHTVTKQTKAHLCTVFVRLILVGVIGHHSFISSIFCRIIPWNSWISFVFFCASTVNVYSYFTFFVCTFDCFGWHSKRSWPYRSHDSFIKQISFMILIVFHSSSELYLIGHIYAGD